MKKILLLIVAMLVLSSCASTYSYASQSCVKPDCDIIAVHNHMY